MQEPLVLFVYKYTDRYQYSSIYSGISTNFGKGDWLLIVLSYIRHLFQSASMDSVNMTSQVSQFLLPSHLLALPRETPYGKVFLILPARGRLVDSLECISQALSFLEANRSELKPSPLPS